MRRLSAICSLALLVPGFVFAQIVINEIMYDAEGVDTDHEWVEIHNDGASPVDITGWKINDGSNHVLNVPPKNGSKGSMVIEAGGYLVLAAHAADFAGTHSSVPNVIDTALSFNNTGDTVSLLDSEGTAIDTITYTKDSGAAGDGNTLHREGSTLRPGAPSPGAGEIPPAIEPPASSETSSHTSNNTTSSTQESSQKNPSASKTASSAPLQPQLSVSAGKDRSVIAGADIRFEGIAQNERKETVDAAHFVWNLGDGTVAEGQSISHNFQYAGRYVIMLKATYNGLQASHQIIIDALAANLALSTLDDGGLAIENRMSRDIDLSLWYLRDSGKSFTIPANTTLLKGATLRFSARTLGFAAEAYTELLYPNGTHAFSIGEEKVEAKKQSTATAHATVSKKSVAKKTEEDEEDVQDAERVQNINTVQNDSTEHTEETQVAAAASFWDGGMLWWGGAATLTLLGAGAVYAFRRTNRQEWLIEDASE